MLPLINHSLSFSGDIPNSSEHFAIGDLAKWSGIKRCGSAMHMGYLAAVNIHQLFRQSLSGSVPEFVTLDEIPPMIGLAIGKQAVSYWPEGGISSGEDVMEAFFGKDLGFTSKRPFLPLRNVQADADTVCWNYLQLGLKA